MNTGLKIFARNRTGQLFSVPVDDAVYHSQHKYRWRINRDGYVCRNTRRGQKNTTVFLHRLAVNCPRGKEVDHKDRDRTNNVGSNLQIVTPVENKALAVLRRRWSVTYRIVA